MKRLYILLTALLVTVTAFAQSGKELYQKYSDLPEVSAIYISPAMFRIIGRLPSIELEAEDIDLVPIIRSMSGFYMLSCEGGVGEKLYKEVSKLVSKGTYELLLEAKENGEATRIYSAGSANEVTSLILLTRDTDDEVTYIGIDGRMDREKLENILAEAAK